MNVALVTEVFHDGHGPSRLRELLGSARAGGAELAVLPELPLNSWAPASKEASEADGEDPGGRRQTAMSAAAAEAGVAVLGGAIVRDPESGARYNTALLYGADGALLASYRKVHLPEEEGYWETSHYAAGAEPPPVVAGLPLRLGLQICSDVNRPTGFQLLAAGGAEVVLAPRATPPETYERWKLVLRAAAVTSATYVISVNRPRPELGAAIGGPSIAIDPFGEVIAETTEPVELVSLDPAVVRDARREYPGYLARFPALYAEAWRRLAEG